MYIWYRSRLNQQPASNDKMKKKHICEKSEAERQRKWKRKWKVVFIILQKKKFLSYIVFCLHFFLSFFLSCCFISRRRNGQQVNNNFFYIYYIYFSWMLLFNMNSLRSEYQIGEEAKNCLTFIVTWAEIFIWSNMNKNNKNEIF